MSAGDESLPPILSGEILCGPEIGSAMTLRIPGLAVGYDKEKFLAKLSDVLGGVCTRLAPGRVLVTAEQTHGNAVAVVQDLPTGPIPEVDALVTQRSDVILGIAVADCCPVWLWTPNGKAIGLVHAGRKGAESGIVAKAAEKLGELAGADCSQISAFLGPCIRPPDYEVNIPALIHEQLMAIGCVKIGDCGLNTASDPGRFYSYRKEKGLTGRMMALAWIRKSC